VTCPNCHLEETVRGLMAWCDSRIRWCRETEKKFAGGFGIEKFPPQAQKHPPQALVEAWTERRALQAVLEQLKPEKKP
jgi:hypothetical protein